ncbi:MAG: lipocalin family protein [Chryseobacterium sp.]|jgi:hypothetical protein|uniref:lipocalin family protein n=1 Tax=Chryseobacterium sp. TaxID=1871047 RepID=UPI00281E7B4A|nr:lipocalin family protein [Chryseobacterium sp.]MDR2235153.1 lipocalin family protein [Chryseobacterium sp.]
MKKQLLLFAFSALALTSCDDDNMEAYNLELMSGEWKVSKKETISGKDNKTVLKTETPTGCDAKSTYYFRSDHYISYTAYSGTGLECVQNSKNEGEFTYNDESKLLSTKFKNDDERWYRVEVLTSKELKMAQLFDASDINDDEVDDITYITYTR